MGACGGVGAAAGPLPCPAGLPGRRRGRRGGRAGAAGRSGGREPGGAALGWPAGDRAGAGGAQISLATATLEEFEALDGIGPALARRIVEYREAHGGFRSVDELAQVDGIGEKRLAALKTAVRP
ncbi:MAG TPA: ComEA family DNA-binding protein [Thermoleophilaceae bacterium]|nr:ComEA family DNA-binding protein [Thermoleophilaceae bacterium]